MQEHCSRQGVPWHGSQDAAEHAAAEELARRSDALLPSLSQSHPHMAGVQHVAFQDWAPTVASYIRCSEQEYPNGHIQSRSERWTARHCSMPAKIPRCADPGPRKVKPCYFASKCLCRGTGKRVKLLAANFRKVLQDRCSPPPLKQKFADGFCLLLFRPAETTPARREPLAEHIGFFYRPTKCCSWSSHASRPLLPCQLDLLQASETYMRSLAKDLSNRFAFTQTLKFSCCSIWTLHGVCLACSSRRRAGQDSSTTWCCTQKAQALSLSLCGETSRRAFSGWSWFSAARG